jgi:pimeloyl-ACP methyl ester carboxylesterase
MHANRHLIFIHGLMGSSQGVKAGLLRGIFPHILTPDFSGSLEERMEQLERLVGDEKGWTIIGSSLGGLMAALFASRRPAQVDRLILLAPALIWPDFAEALPAVLEMPTTIYHGSRDELIPAEQVRAIAERVFSRLDFHLVDDDHGLYETAHALDWKNIV